MSMEDTRTMCNRILSSASARRHTGSRGDFEAHLSRTDTYISAKGHKCQNDEQHDPQGSCSMVRINKEKNGQWTNTQREGKHRRMQVKDDKNYYRKLEFTDGTIWQEKHSELLKA